MSERGRVIGGVCVDTGTIPSKTFREVVLSLNGRTFPDSSQVRLGSVVRPTAQELLAWVAEVKQRQTDIVEDQLRRNDVMVLKGEARFTDPHTVVVTSDELLQLTRLPRRLTVVGAGVIGIEYASVFAALGIAVTVIDKRDRLLEFLDREIVDELLSQIWWSGMSRRRLR